jgi:tetratricopeptide (TPR) repeat protein
MDASFVERIDDLIEDDDLAGAEIELASVAETDRTAPAYLLAAALLAAEDDDDAGAIEAAKVAVAATADTGSCVLRARALLALGKALAQAGLCDEALTAYCELVEWSGDSDDARARWMVAKTLMCQAAIFDHLSDPQRLWEAYRQIVDRFGNAPELSLREMAAIALVNSGPVLGAMGRPDEELTTYDEVVTRFGDAEEVPLRKWVAGALFNKGMTFGELGRRDDELTAYDAVIERFGDSAEPELCEQVAKALVNKGVLLHRTGRYETALDTFDEVIDRFGETRDVLIIEQVAKGLLYAGDTLKAIGSPDAARDAYRQIVDCFSDAPAECLQELAREAMFRMVNMVSGESERERWIQMQEPEVQDQLRRTPRPRAAEEPVDGPSLKEMEEFVAACPDDAFGWATLAQLYGEAGRWQEAVKSWERALGVEPDLFEDPLAKAADAEGQYLEAKRRAGQT